MQQHHLRHHQTVVTRLRASLRASVLALLAMCSLLMSQWQGQALATVESTLAASTQTAGGEAPLREFTEEQAPAKLRRAAPMHAARAVSEHPASSVLPQARSVTCAALIPFAVSSAIPSDGVPITPPCWRQHCSQAPPLA